MSTTEADASDEARARTRGEDKRVRARGAAGAASAPLVIHADRSSPAGETVDRQARRDVAYGLRTRLWDLSTLDRVRHCGRYTHGGEGGPVLRLSGSEGDRRAGMAGLQSCGSVWSCPVCCRRIGAERAEELRQVVEVVAERRGSAALVTLTARHHRGQSLRECWDALSYAWSRVTAGKAYVGERELFGLVGWCRAVEVTVGESGWHVHLHVLVLMDCPVSDDLLDELTGRWWSRWERALGRRGFTASADHGGLDCRPVAMTGAAPATIAAYFVKIAYEVTGQATKDGRFGNRTPMQVLADGCATGLADDLEAWWEFERTSRGRRQMTWSLGLRAWAGVGPRRTDEEIASEDHGGEDVLAIEPESWPLVREHVSELLAAAERDGADGAHRWLSARGARWFRPPQRERVRPVRLGGRGSAWLPRTSGAPC